MNSGGSGAAVIRHDLLNHEEKTVPKNTPIHIISIINGIIAASFVVDIDLLLH
jgi:hypothetical protein